MSPPLLILLARPNGAGKTSLYETFLAARFPNLPFVNADRIAAERWPGGLGSRCPDPGLANGQPGIVHN